jgi:hypothetical protein
MSPEKLKETRMKIAYNVIQGMVAYNGVFDPEAVEFEVYIAYQIADEVLKQGGYNV